MKKGISIISLFLFSFAFAQLSEIPKIDKEVNKRYDAIHKKYRKKQSEERLKEEAEVYAYKAAAYKNAIENIQKNEIKVDLNSISNDFTKEATFESEIFGFRKLFMENFDTSSIDGERGTLKSILIFLIDEKGEISNINAEGNDAVFNYQAILTLYKILDKGKFKPAEKDGIAVKSVFRMPLTMNFE